MFEVNNEQGKHERTTGNQKTENRGTNKEKKKRILVYKNRGLQRVFFLGMLVDQPNKQTKKKKKKKKEKIKKNEMEKNDC